MFIGYAQPEPDTPLSKPSSKMICASFKGINDLQSHLDSQRKDHLHHPRFKGYRSARRALFTQFGSTVEALYTGRQVSQSKSHKKRAPKGMNCEHLFPRAWMGGRKNKRFRQMEADLHNLYPSEIQVNSRRGHLPFGRVEFSRYPKAAPSKIGYNSNKQEVIEPRDERKGDIARSILYFALKWKRRLPGNQYKTLLDWAQKDPVDQIERKRNRRIFQLQGHSNPFVECPEVLKMMGPHFKDL